MTKYLHIYDGDATQLTGPTVLILMVISEEKLQPADRDMTRQARFCWSHLALCLAAVSA